jgi:hypothetical protein
MNTNCYRFEKFFFQKGLLDNCVDATYIIHLEDNGRFESIMNQLDEYHPTKLTYIVFNKGYKNCEKKDYINIPPYDLVDAFLKVFKHANQNNYNNILILEDDFIFHKDIKKKFIQKDICTFINKQQNKNFQYLLGCIPLIKLPCHLKCKHYVCVLSLGSHACIYSKKNRIETLKVKQQIIKDWDAYHWYYNKRYTYYKPLCYQLFSETDNSKYWNYNYYILYIGGKLLLIIFKCLQLDKQVEPGYSFFYLFSKLLPVILVVLLILLLIPIIRRIIKIKKIRF